jgi:hypothetical protein
MLDVGTREEHTGLPGRPGVRFHEGQRTITSAFGVRHRQGDVGRAESDTHGV